ncbi:MAG: hypothetical protein AAF228_08850 [Pseudomonadota bacterium]
MPQLFSKMRIHTKIFRVLITTMVVLVISLLSVTASGEDRNNSPSRDILKIYVFKDKIKNVIQEIASKHNFATKFSGSLKGIVERRKLVGTRDEIFDELSKQYSFEWFVHNNSLYISNKSETTTRVITLEGIRGNRALSALKKAQLSLDKFVVNVMDENNTFIVTGPPNYVALIEAVMSSLKKPERLTNTFNSVTIYRGTQKTKEKISN